MNCKCASDYWLVLIMFTMSILGLTFFNVTLMAKNIKQAILSVSSLSIKSCMLMSVCSDVECMLMCLHMYIDECEGLLSAYFNWCDRCRCSNHTNKNRLVLSSISCACCWSLITSDVLSPLPFSDSTCYFCVSIHSLFLWSMAKNKRWMNELLH